MDAPLADPLPGKSTIGRTCASDGADCVCRGAAGTVDWFDRFGPVYAVRPWV